jgi:phosphatidate cytidylyltransferase/phytol kinase
MTKEIYTAILLALGFLAIFGLAEIGYHFLKLKAEYTRKFVHIASGLLTLTFPVLLTNQWLVLALCVSFAGLLLGSLALGFLPSINAVGRFTLGSLAYPTAVYGTFLVYSNYQNLLYFYYPILTLAICDPIAALVGRRTGWKKYSVANEHKSLSGSIAFFVAALILGFVLLAAMNFSLLLPAVITVFFVAVLSAITEGISPKGLDNLTIPAIVVIVLLFADFA